MCDMIFRETNIKKLGVDKSTRFSLQKGNDSTGVTGPVSGLTLNAADFNEEKASSEYIIPSYHSIYPYPLVRVVYAYTDRSTYANLHISPFDDTDNYLNRFSTGDQIQLQRDNIKRQFTIGKVVRLNSTTLPVIQLMNDRNNESDSFSELDNFLDVYGYPYITSKTTVNFSKKLEHSAMDINGLQDFYLDFNQYEFSDSYSAKVTWKVDDSVSAVRLRWRSVPRNKKISNLNFSLSGSTEFTAGPVNIEVQSDTGSNAKLELSGGISQIVVTDTGHDYVNAPIVNIDGGLGYGASATSYLTGDEVTSFSVDYIGSGYVYPPTVTISGDGKDAAGSAYILMDSLNVLQEGGGYLSAPNVKIDFSNAIGTTSSIIYSYIWLQTEGTVDYVRVIDGGSGYTGASVSVHALSVPYTQDAIGYAEIVEGSIVNIVLTNNGYGFTDYSPFIEPSTSIVSFGTGGTGAVLKANVDIASEWIYGEDVFDDNSYIIHGLKRNIPYEVQILTSSDKNFIGDISYSESILFNYI